MAQSVLAMKIYIQFVMDTPLYRQLAQNLADQVRNGTFKTGDKLPSVRAYARQQGVSISTVTMSYSLLEDWRLVEVRPKSGYYVRNIPGTVFAPPKIRQQGDSEPRRVTTSQVVMDVMRDSSNPKYLSLGAAIPANDFPILTQLRKSFSQLVRTEQFLGIGYDSTKGNEQLRRQLARRAVDAGVYLGPEDIVVTAGCQGAINLCLQSVCHTGDIVAVESPAYYGLLQLIESLGLKVIEIPSDPKEGMSIEALKLALEQWPVRAILSVPNFSNPLGTLMPDESKRRLISLINEYDIPLIEDDIYADLTYGESRPKAVKAFDNEDRVLLCSSVSKVLDPQLGMGWVMPGRYLEKIEYKRFLSSSSHFRLPQMAVASLLARGSYDRHLRLARETYRQRRDQLFDFISRDFPQETRLSEPQGGFVAWMQLPEQVDATDVYLKAKERGIIIAPGEIFSSNPNKYRHSIRLSYAREWTTDYRQAISDLGEIIASTASG